MDEVGFWSERIRPNLVKSCQQLGLRFHFERIENVVNDGTPDVDYCIEGIVGKIELKYNHTAPREDSQVLAVNRGMRRSQIIYASRHVWAGGRCWCLIGNQVATWLVDLRGMTPQDMDSLSVANTLRLRQIAVWHRGPRLGATLPLALIERLPQRPLPQPDWYARAFGKS
jgi:hypothetical protein